MIRIHVAAVFRVTPPRPAVRFAPVCLAQRSAAAGAALVGQRQPVDRPCARQRLLRSACEPRGQLGLVPRHRHVRTRRFRQGAHRRRQHQRRRAELLGQLRHARPRLCRQLLHRRVHHPRGPGAVQPGRRAEPELRELRNPVTRLRERRQVGRLGRVLERGRVCSRRGGGEVVRRLRHLEALVQRELPVEWVRGVRRSSFGPDG